MKDKEKQIEEMAKVMQKCYEKNGLLNFKWLAESAYKCLTEDSVVLSREEFEKLKNISNLVPKLSIENLKLKEEQKEMLSAIAKDNSVNWLLKQDRRITEKRVSKETVEKVVNLLTNNGERQTLDIEDDEGNICDKAYIIPQSHLRQVAKQVGVEIKEN